MVQLVVPRFISDLQMFSTLYISYMYIVYPVFTSIFPREYVDVDVDVDMEKLHLSTCANRAMQC
jgi:hypothetical protein